MNNELGEREEAPERIWLLKSVVALLGTRDFAVPEKAREHAFEYVRADRAATRMRERCVSVVKALFHNSEVNHSRWNEAIVAAVKELQSLTLDGEKER